MKGKLAVLLGALMVLVIFSIAAYCSGRVDGRAAVLAEQAEQGKKVVKVETAKTAVKINQAEVLATVDAEKTLQRQEHTKVVTKWIVKHVPIDRPTGLSDHWLRGHDAAASGADPAALVPKPTLGAPAGPSDGEVLLAVSGNYALANSYRDRYHSCRVQLAQELGKPPEWVRENLPSPE